MVFDCLNEVLDSFRPFGLAGQPYPWKVTIRANKPKQITEDNIDAVIEKSRARVLEWAQYLCGYYGENDEFMKDKTASFTEEYLAQIKEDRLSRMLATDVRGFLKK